MRVRNFITEEICNMVRAAGDNGYDYICLDFAKQTATATDKTLLVKRKFTVPQAYALHSKVGVSVEAFKYMRKLLKENTYFDVEIAEEAFKVYTNGGTVVKDFTLFKNIPDFESVIPSDNREEYKIHLNPSLIANMIAGLSLSKTEGITLHFDKSDPLGTIKLSKNGKTLGVLKPMSI